MVEYSVYFMWSGVALENLLVNLPALEQMELFILV
jgi:hypothetical protein